MITIESGLQDRCVLQRSVRNVSDASITGTTGQAGTVEARVTLKGKVVKGFDWKPIGTAGRGKFSAKLTGLPCAGPYTVSLRVAPNGKATSSKKNALTGALQTDVKDVLVGDVWIAGGQSNMQGCGIGDPVMPAHPMVRALYMNDQWAPAKDPIHNLWDCVDEAHIIISGGARQIKPKLDTWGVGPAVGFAQEMHRLTGVPQGILACAHGGTSMMQWDPAKKSEGSKSLYGATLRRVAKCGGRVAGLIWYQGCSDANKADAAVYTDRMKKLVSAFRRDCRDAALPVAIVQIARVAWMDFDVTNWNAIQEQQRRLGEKIRNLHTVPAIDLELDDLIHIGGHGQARLGKRLAGAMANLKGLGKTHAHPQKTRVSMAPIAFKRFAWETDRNNGMVNIRVDFDNVAGKLISAGPAAGFAVTNPAFCDVIYKTTLHGTSALLHTSLTADQVDGKYLHYGLGVNPFCTITDQQDRSLPVFGPVPISQKRAVTSFAHHFRVSDLLPAPASFEAIALPACELAPRFFASDFCDMHGEIGAAAESRLLYFATAFECTEPMKLAACLGYDGPLKVFIDGREVFADAAGTNPALPDKAVVPFDAAAGRHEVVLALHTNHGNAWGVRIRLERKDVTRGQLKDPATLALPKWLEA